MRNQLCTAGGYSSYLLTREIEDVDVIVADIGNLGPVGRKARIEQRPDSGRQLANGARISREQVKPARQCEQDLFSIGRKLEVG